MSNWLIIFIYCIVAYGWTNMQVYGSGPFRIFERIRNGADYLSEHFGQLFTCFMCFPANLGIVLSLLNWFFLPTIALTPFNILLGGTELWWLAAIGDCCFTSGIVWLIHNVESFFENLAKGTEIVQEMDNDEKINLHD